MRDHDGNGAARAQPQDCARQRLIAFGVEIGIRLVQYDQKRIAVEGARKRDALRLSGRECAAVLADHGVVALGQVNDEIVHAGRLGRGDHGIGIRRILEATDVLRHRAVEQFDVLRHVTDMPAKCF